MNHNITVTTAQPHHAAGITRVICRAYQVPDGECGAHDLIPTPDEVRQQIAQFPEGIFIALDGETVVGAALTLQTNHQPDEEPLKWLDAIGGMTARHHDPQGEWLYGFEFGVDPTYQGRGIGTMLYDIRFRFIQERNLRGYFAGGMLMGYHRYVNQLTPREYGEKVILGEIADPTVTMQINRGFRPVQVIEDYLDEPLSGNAAVLIVWENPTYHAQAERA